MDVIDDAFSTLERTIKRETLWLPVVVSIAWGGSLGLLLWDLFTGDEIGMGISHAIVLTFAILQVWIFWDVDARRRVALLKYETAARILDPLVTEYGWTWEETEEPNSVALESPRREEMEDAEQ